MKATLRSDMEKMEMTLRGEIEALRRDMKKMETRLRGEIQEVLSEVKSLRRDMEEMETRLCAEFRAELRAFELRMTIKLGGLLVLAVGLMTMIDRLLGPAAP